MLTASAARSCTTSFTTKQLYQAQGNQNTCRKGTTAPRRLLQATGSVSCGGGIYTRGKTLNPSRQPCDPAQHHSPFSYQIFTDFILSPRITPDRLPYRIALTATRGGRRAPHGRKSVKKAFSIQLIHWALVKRPRAEGIPRDRRGGQRRENEKISSFMTLSSTPSDASP